MGGYAQPVHPYISLRAYIDHTLSFLPGGLMASKVLLYCHGQFLFFLSFNILLHTREQQEGSIIRKILNVCFVSSRVHVPKFSVFVCMCKMYSFLCDAVLTAKLVPPKRREQKQEQPKCLASCCRGVLNSGLVHTCVFFSVPNVAFSTALWPLIRTPMGFLGH